jgi:NADPH:quinone reductase-like Zn-dependent oxidoreductase
VKAVIFHEHGGPEVLRYEDVDDPRPGKGEVLVRVGAATVNRGPDQMVRGGGFGIPGFAGLPHVSGADAAGEVAELGEGVEALEVGDPVVVYPLLWDGDCDLCRSGAGENYCRNWRMVGVHTWGGYADFVVVPAQNLVKLPPGVSYEQAATLTVTYNTTWHGLVQRAGTTADDTVLVMAAGSGVGVAAIQLAKLLGARVIATTGAGWKQERALALGADAAFNYKDENWPAQVREATGGRGVSVVFDNIGADTFAQSLSCLDRGGRLFCSGATGSWNTQIDLRGLYRNMNTLHFHMQGSKADVVEMVRLVGEGRLDPVIDSTYPLADVVHAQEKLAAMEQFGKVVLVPEGAPRPGGGTSGAAGAREKALP